MNISLPQSLRTWVDRQVDQGGFGTASEFIRHLVRQARAKNADLEASLIEAMNGPSSPMTDTTWERIRRKGRERSAELRKRAPSRRKSA